MFGPLRTLGVPEPVIDVVEPFFRVIVELGYDRSIPPWEPTPARLIPPLDPATVAGDLVDAIGEGITNAAALIGVATAAEHSRARSPQIRNAAVEQVVSAPGTTLKRVSRDVGDGVSRVLTAVGSPLPKPPAVTRDDLAGKPAQGRSRAGGHKRPDQPDHRCGEVGHRRRAHDRAAPPAVTTAHTAATASPARKTPVRDAVKNGQQ